MPQVLRRGRWPRPSTKKGHAGIRYLLRAIYHQPHLKMQLFFDFFLPPCISPFASTFSHAQRRVCDLSESGKSWQLDLRLDLQLVQTLFPWFIITRNPAFLNQGNILFHYVWLSWEPWFLSSMCLIYSGFTNSWTVPVPFPYSFSGWAKLSFDMAALTISVPL